MTIDFSPIVQICVKKCPTETFLAIAEVAQIGEALTKTKLICKENVTVSQMSVKELVDKGHCASYYLQSEPSKSHASITIFLLF